MTGEMHESEVTREAYPLHFAIADELGGEVRPFDQYQGPYVQTPKGNLWLCPLEDTCFVFVYNERTGNKSACFPWDAMDELVVEAALEVTA